MMEFLRKQTYLTPVQDRAIKRLAARYHTTEAEVLRRAVDSWIRREEGEDEDPFAHLIGFVDGPGNVDHNDIYR